MGYLISKNRDPGRKANELLRRSTSGYKSSMSSDFEYDNMDVKIESGTAMSNTPARKDAICANAYQSMIDSTAHLSCSDSEPLCSSIGQSGEIDDGESTEARR